MAASFSSKPNRQDQPIFPHETFQNLSRVGRKETYRVRLREKRAFACALETYVSARVPFGGSGIGPVDASQAVGVYIFAAETFVRCHTVFPVFTVGALLRQSETIQ